MIKLRKFYPRDLDQVMEIEKASFPEPYSRKYFLRLYQKFPDGFLIAENKEDLIGYIIGGIKNNSAEIISIAVDPNWQRKRIGTELYNSLINQFKKREIKEVFLHVRTKNQAGIAFYKRLGFKVLKTIVNYYQNGEDAYLMRKEI